MDSPPTLCLMLKAPRAGEVKTRLAASIGEAAAAEVYRGLVEHQAAEIPRDWRIEVHFTPASAEAEMRDWLAPRLPEQTTFHPQVEGNLSPRLRAALEAAVARGAKEVLFVGGDCPQLSTERLCAAASVLHTADFVIIPAVDGGYVLIGLAGPHGFVFDDIAWSTPAVFEQTRRAIQARGKTLQTFPPLEDVDDIPSLLRARDHSPALRVRADSPRS